MSDLKEPYVSHGEHAIKLIDDILKTFDNDINHKTTTGYFLFVVGCSGAGKTTLGQNFKTEHKWIHFDCDQWAYGQHPLNDSGKPIAPESLQKRSQELIDAYDKLAVEKGYQALFKDETPPLSVWIPYYNLLAKEIMKIRAIHNNKNMICTQSVYPSCVRQYLRGVMSKDLRFIILNTSTELLTKRIIDRDTLNANKRGHTLEEYINTFGDEWTLERYEKNVPIRFKGFETIQQNEPNTFQIDVNENMTMDDVFHAAEKILLQI